MNSEIEEVKKIGYPSWEIPKTLEEAEDELIKAAEVVDKLEKILVTDAQLGIDRRELLTKYVQWVLWFNNLWYIRDVMSMKEGISMLNLLNTLITLMRRERGESNDKNSEV